MPTHPDVMDRRSLGAALTRYFIAAGRQSHRLDLWEARNEGRPVDAFEIARLVEIVRENVLLQQSMMHALLSWVTSGDYGAPGDEGPEPPTSGDR